MRHSIANCDINLKFGPTPDADASMSSTINSSASFSLNIFTALIGSPTYLSSWNRTVLTSPPFLINRHGMILGLNISHLRKVLQESSPVVMTLLWMELHTEDVCSVDRASELCPVV